MQLPRLDITNTFAHLGMKQQKATINIRQPKAEMKINQPQPEIKITKSESKFEIDQTEAFADANIKHPFRMVKELTAKAIQKLRQNISQEVAEGDRLMGIDRQKENVIPQIAKEESETPLKEINLGYLPENPNNVKFHYQPSNIDIKVHQGNLNINIKPNYPTIKFNPGDLHMYLKQKASMQIKVVGATLDQKI